MKTWTTPIVLFIALIVSALAGRAQAADFDLKMNSINGSTKLSIIDSDDVEVASITSKGDAYFRTMAASGNSVSYRVTADSSTTANTLGLTPLSFSIGASESWSFEFYLYVNGVAGGGTRWAINAPSGATMRVVIQGTNTAATNFTSEVLTAVNTASANAYVNGFATGWIRITGVVDNGVNAGNVQLKFLSVTGGNTNTLKANSHFNARKTQN